MADMDDVLPPAINKKPLSLALLDTTILADLPPMVTSLPQHIVKQHILDHDFDCNVNRIRKCIVSCTKRKHDLPSHTSKQSKCCRCGCIDKLAIANVVKWWNEFNQLTNVDQYRCVWRIVNEAFVRAGAANYCQIYRFLGMSVCRKSLQLLTRCSRRLKDYRTMIGQGTTQIPCDLREVIAVRKTTRLSSNMSSFLTYVYWSCAESLPLVRRGETPIEHDCNGSRPSLSYGDDDMLTIYVDSTAANDSIPMGLSVTHTSSRIGGRELWPHEKRCLESCSMRDQWYLYVANERRLYRQAASYPSFVRHWRRDWRGLIAFRNKTVFSKCNQCVKYK